MPCASLRLRRALIPAVGVASPFILAGCSGVQSALDPAGKDAEVLANLFWVLLAGAGVLWLSMNGFFFYVNLADKVRKLGIPVYRNEWGRA